MAVFVSALVIPALLAFAAAEPCGTPRIAARTVDATFPPDLASGPDTLILGSWKFGAGSTCDAQGWASADLTAGTTDFGDHAALITGSEQLQSDACARGLGCMWAFTAGSSDTYGCGGQAAQAAVPSGDPGRGYIWNEIWSPPVAVTGTGSAFNLSFQVYRDLDLANLVFYTWRVRSLTAGVPGPWVSHGDLFYGASRGDWFYQVESIGDLIVPGADSIQVALGVVDMKDAWNGIFGDGTCHSNAPLFDNVKLYRLGSFGPQWSVEPADLFQDNFATDGTLTGTVRIDMARDIDPRDLHSIRPGDSLVVSVGEPTVGLDSDANGGPAVYLHVRDVAPQKSGAVISGDPARWPVTSAGNGWTVLRFDSVRTGTGVVPGRFCVDLADDLYTPGDVIEFYFSARDALGRVTYWTEFKRTTASPPDGSSSGPFMEVTCLPVNGLKDWAILYVDDADGTGAQPFFDASFQQLGITDQVDRYDVRGADAMVGNGPGSRVRNVEAQLSHSYDSIIWSSGSAAHGLIGDGSGSPEKSPDAQMLVEYLQEKPPWGVLYLNGDNLASELSHLPSPSALALRSYISYQVTSSSHAASLGITPRVFGTPVSVFQTSGKPHSFYVYGGCPVINTFDVLSASGPAVVEATYGSGSSGAIVSQSTGDDWVVLSGFGFEYIRDDESDGISDRTEHLAAILSSRDPTEPCGSTTSYVTPDAAGIGFTWNVPGACSEVVAIRVNRARAGEATMTKIAEVAVPPYGGSFVDDEPAVGERVRYRLTQLRTRGREDVIDTVVAVRPAAVSSLRVRSLDVGIEVSWQLADRTALLSVALQRRPSGQGAFAAVAGDSALAPDATRAVDRSFEPGRSYDYRLLLDYGDQAIPTSAVPATAPRALALGQNAPNPFNPSTRIRFLAPSAGELQISVFDVGGARIRRLGPGKVAAGVGEVSWDGTDDGGRAVASGVYFYRLSAFGQTLTRKMVLVR